MRIFLVRSRECFLHVFQQAPMPGSSPHEEESNHAAVDVGSADDAQKAGPENSTVVATTKEQPQENSAAEAVSAVAKETNNGPKEQTASSVPVSPKDSVPTATEERREDGTSTSVQALGDHEKTAPSPSPNSTPLDSTPSADQMKTTLPTSVDDTTQASAMRTDQEKTTTSTSADNTVQASNTGAAQTKAESPVSLKDTTLGPTTDTDQDKTAPSSTHMETVQDSTKTPDPGEKFSPAPASSDMHHALTKGIGEETPPSPSVEDMPKTAAVDTAAEGTLAQNEESGASTEASQSGEDRQLNDVAPQPSSSSEQLTLTNTQESSPAEIDDNAHDSHQAIITEGKTNNDMVDAQTEDVAETERLQVSPPAVASSDDIQESPARDKEATNDGKPEQSGNDAEVPEQEDASPVVAVSEGVDKDADQVTELVPGAQVQEEEPTAIVKAGTVVLSPETRVPMADSQLSTIAPAGEANRQSASIDTADQQTMVSQPSDPVASLAETSTIVSDSSEVVDQIASSQATKCEGGASLPEQTPAVDSTHLAVVAVQVSILLIRSGNDIDETRIHMCTCIHKCMLSCATI